MITVHWTILLLAYLVVLMIEFLLAALMHANGRDDDGVRRPDQQKAGKVLPPHH